MTDPTAPPLDRVVDDRPAKRRLFRLALAGGPLTDAGYTDTLVLSRESARAVLTPSRLELLERLRAGPAESVRALAAELGRDKAGVSRDLARLAELDVVAYDHVGRAKRPRLKHDTVLVEPVV